MTGPEVFKTVKKLEALIKPLRKQIRDLDDKIRDAKKKCPHEERVPRHGDGVETAVCVYCEDEEHVRTYRCPTD